MKNWKKKLVIIGFWGGIAVITILCLNIIDRQYHSNSFKWANGSTIVNVKVLEVVHTGKYASIFENRKEDCTVLVYENIDTGEKNVILNPHPQTFYYKENDIVQIKIPNINLGIENPYGKHYYGDSILLFFVVLMCFLIFYPFAFSKYRLI